MMLIFAQNLRTN